MIDHVAEGMQAMERLEKLMDAAIEETRKADDHFGRAGMIGGPSFAFGESKYLSPDLLLERSRHLTEAREIMRSIRFLGVMVKRYMGSQTFDGIRRDSLHLYRDGVYPISDDITRW